MNYEMERDALRDWVEQLKETPDSVLRSGWKLYTAQELFDAYAATQRTTNMTANVLGRELARQDFVKAGGGMPCLTKSGQLRLWVVRPLDREEYERQAQAANTYDEERGQ